MDSRRFWLGFLVAGIGIACLVVLEPFLSSIAWAAVLCYATWPVYRVLRKRLRRHDTLAAFLMTAILTALLVAPTLWLVRSIGAETAVAYHALASARVDDYRLPPFLSSIPWLGDEMQRQIAHWKAEPAIVQREAAAWLQHSTARITAVIGRFGRGLAKLLITLLTVFFVYRDGESVVGRGRRALTRFAGTRLDPYLALTAATIRAVVYGLIVAGFAQGLIAGIGYLILGVEGAALLGVLTGLLSIVPVLGTSVVWGTVGLYFLATGHLWKGILMIAWGLAVVHPTDNILRPLLISNVAKTPFLPTMFGVIGGVAAFGLIGTVIGPVVLALGLAIWRRWVDAEPELPR